MYLYTPDGRALIDASAGLFCVAAGHCRPEIAQAGALFHTPGDATELAQRMAELTTDPGLRVVLGRQGRDAATRLFSRQHLINTLIPIYERLASAS